MKHVMIAGVLAFGLGLPAAAQMPQQPISKADFLTRSRAQFAALDADHDGIVTKDELTAGMAKDFGGAPPPQLIDRIFASIDKNGDGKATAAEAEETAAARFDQWDANHDGTLTPEEMMAGREAMRAAQKPQ